MQPTLNRRTVKSWRRHLNHRAHWRAAMSAARRESGRDRSDIDLLGLERLPPLDPTEVDRLRAALLPLEDAAEPYRRTTTLRVDASQVAPAAALASRYLGFARRILGPGADAEAVLYQVKGRPGPGSAFDFEKLWHFDDVGWRLKVWVLVDPVDPVEGGAATEWLLGSHRDAAWRWDPERRLLDALTPESLGSVDIQHHGALLDHQAAELAAGRQWETWTLAGSAGSVIAWDTRLLHRGRELEPGRPPRRLLALQYCTRMSPRHPSRRPDRSPDQI